MALPKGLQLPSTDKSCYQYPSLMDTTSPSLSPIIKTALSPTALSTLPQSVLISSKVPLTPRALHLVARLRALQTSTGIRPIQRTAAQVTLAPPTSVLHPVSSSTITSVRRSSGAAQFWSLIDSTRTRRICRERMSECICVCI